MDLVSTICARISLHQLSGGAWDRRSNSPECDRQEGSFTQGLPVTMSSGRVLAISRQARQVELRKRIFQTNAERLFKLAAPIGLPPLSKAIDVDLQHMTIYPGPLVFRCRSGAARLYLNMVCMSADEGREIAQLRPMSAPIATNIHSRRTDAAASDVLGTAAAIGRAKISNFTAKPVRDDGLSFHSRSPPDTGARRRPITPK